MTDIVVVAGRMVHSVLIGQAPFRVPRQEAIVVVRDGLNGWIADCGGSEEGKQRTLHSYACFLVRIPIEGS